MKFTVYPQTYSIEMEEYPSSGKLTLGLVGLNMKATLELPYHTNDTQALLRHLTNNRNSSYTIEIHARDN